jgi:Glycosyl transferase family 2
LPTPRVTALIDTYNHERYIADAIESVLAQDFPSSEIEIIVVDDGSTDSTCDIVRRFVAKSSSRIRLISKPNGGQASAFNAGIPEARGEIIAFLDGDDAWRPDKLSRVVAHFDAHPEVGVVGHGIEQFDIMSSRRFFTLPRDQRQISFAAANDATFFRHAMCFFGTSRLAIRTRLASQTLPIPESIRIEADEFLAIACTALSRAALLRDPLTIYRLHDSNHYQLRQLDTRKLRTMQTSLESLSVELRSRLAAAGVPPLSIELLVNPPANTARRIRLQLDGGHSFETFAAERAERNFAYTSQSPIGSRAFHAFSLGVALALPPRLYYRLRHWYSSSPLRRLRRSLGEPVSSSQIAVAPSPDPESPTTPVK